MFCLSGNGRCRFRSCPTPARTPQRLLNRRNTLVLTPAPILSAAAITRATSAGARRTQPRLNGGIAQRETAHLLVGALRRQVGRMCMGGDGGVALGEAWESLFYRFRRCKLYSRRLPVSSVLVPYRHSHRVAASQVWWGNQAHVIHGNHWGMCCMGGTRGLTT